VRDVLASRRVPSGEQAPLRAYAAAPPDAWLIAVTASLLAIGLVMVFSASSATAFADHHDPTYYLKRQATWLVVGIVVAYACYRVDYRRLRPLAPYLLVGVILALLAVLVPHLGIAVNGARRWLGVRSFAIQPSEFAKPALIIYLAAMLSTRGERIGSLTKGLVPLCMVTAIVGVLVLAEPDLGTASLYGFVAFAMFFAAGARIAHLIAVAAAVVPPVLVEIVASPYRRARIFAFLHPWKDPENTGFHIVQSLYALGSGGLIGVGLGESREKFFYLPEQYTDFIFSIIGEELGLLGTLLVLALFVAFVYRGIRIALAAPDQFGYFLAVGCTALIGIQALVNIGVVTSSWPVTGVPLPFISFGGSSLVVNLAAVGLIANVGRRRRLDARD
jgi:cell division protein FtsW